MQKIFYTDKDIEDIVKKATLTSLFIGEGEVVLALARKKAERLGLKLIYQAADVTPSIPNPISKPLNGDTCQTPAFDICSINLPLAMNATGIFCDLLHEPPKKSCGMPLWKPAGWLIKAG